MEKVKTKFKIPKYIKKCKIIIDGKEASVIYFDKKGDEIDNGKKI